MNCSLILTIGGLTLDVIGAAILILPNLRRTRNINDDYITSMDKATGDYTQRKHILEQKLNLIGLVFLVIGFLLQLLGVISGSF